MGAWFVIGVMDVLATVSSTTVPDLLLAVTHLARGTGDDCRLGAFIYVSNVYSRDWRYLNVSTIYQRAKTSIVMNAFAHVEISKCDY